MLEQIHAHFVVVVGRGIRTRWIERKWIIISSDAYVYLYNKHSKNDQHSTRLGRNQTILLTNNSLMTVLIADAPACSRSFSTHSRCALEQINLLIIFVVLVWWCTRWPSYQPSYTHKCLSTNHDCFYTFNQILELNAYTHAMDINLTVTNFCMLADGRKIQMKIACWTVFHPRKTKWAVCEET